MVYDFTSGEVPRLYEELVNVEKRAYDSRGSYTTVQLAVPIFFQYNEGRMLSAPSVAIVMITEA